MNAPPASNHRPPLRLIGRLDASSGADLDARLKAEFDAGTVDLVLDLGEATYVSTSVLRSLVLAHRRQQTRGGRVTLTNVAPRIYRILALCGFDRVFHLADPDGP